MAPLAFKAILVEVGRGTAEDLAPGARRSETSSERPSRAAPVDYELLLAARSEPLLVLRPDAPRFTVVWVSDAYLEMTGTERRELVGRGVLDATGVGGDRANAEELLATLERTLSTLRPDSAGVPRSAVRRRVSDGLTRPELHVRYEAAPVRGRDGALAYVLLELAGPTAHELAADELGRALAEQRAMVERLERELDGFCYSVCHDLRAPLRVIDGFAQALESDYSGVLDAQGRHYLERLGAGARRMSELIDDLASLSRIQRAPLAPRQVDVTELAQHIVRELAAAEPARAVDVKIAPGLTAHADPQLFAVALRHLLENAWKFTSRTTGARVELRQHGALPGAPFELSDNGVGFDMQYAGRLFSPFQRMHKATEFSGRGIGLAIVQRILQRHGGRIWAEARPDGGARFSFSLPVQALDGARAST